MALEGEKPGLQRVHNFRPPPLTAAVLFWLFSCYRHFGWWFCYALPSQKEYQKEDTHTVVVVVRDRLVKADFIFQI